MITCKTAAEIEKMREAGRIVASVLQLVSRMVEPGLRTRTIDEAADRFIRSRGASPTFKGYRGYAASICISINEEVVHGIPGGRKLKEGDIVSLDCGATLDGYIGDAAVTLPVGRIRPELATLLEATRTALWKGIEAARPGRFLGDISHAVEQVARTHGYGIVRDYCGHGVGRELHEAPQVPNYGSPGRGPRITPGWTIAIEPMFNLGTFEVVQQRDGWTVVTADGRPSAHFEHTIAVTPDGPVVLTLP